MIKSAKFGKLLNSLFFAFVFVASMASFSNNTMAMEYLVDTPGGLFNHGQPVVSYGGSNYYYCSDFSSNEITWTSDLVLINESYFEGNFSASGCRTAILAVYGLQGDAVEIIVIPSGSENYSAGVHHTNASRNEPGTEQTPFQFTNPFEDDDPPDDDGGDGGVPAHTFTRDPVDITGPGTAIDGGGFGTYVFCSQTAGSDTYRFVGGDDEGQCDQSLYVPRITVDRDSLPEGEGSVIGAITYEDENGDVVTDIITIQVPDFSTPDDDEGEEEDEPTCDDSEIPLAWVLCPVASFFLDGLDRFVQQGVVRNILDFDALDSGSGQREALNSVWNGFRAIANVMFVIAFFVLVYAAATGNALASYDVKKLAPKIVIGALLVQLSFFISTVLVQIFNSLGNSITRLMLAPIAETTGGNAVDSLFIETNVDFNFLSGFVQGLTSVIILILIIIGVIFSVSGILIMIMVFVIRNMALLVLTVISPIAFAAWILPNTQSLFKRWWDAYIQLLALFPLAMAFLASGRLVSAIWTSGENTTWANQWIGMIALFAPYIIAPRMFSLAGSAVGSVVGGIENSRKSLKERTGQVRKTEFGKRAESRIRSGAATRINQRYGVGGKSEKSVIGRAVQTGMVQRSTARAQQTQRNIKAEDTKAARINVDANRISSQKGFSGFLRDDAGQVISGADGEPVRLPAELKGDDAEIEYLTQVLESDKATGEEKASAVDALINVHTSDGRAIQAVNTFMVGTDGQGGLAASSKQEEGDLYNRILEQNGGELSSIPHLAYPNSASSISQLDAKQFHGMAAGSVAAFMKDPGASDAMIERTIQAVNASGELTDAPRPTDRPERHSTEAQFVRDANVAIMYTNANAAQRARLDAQFDIEQLPEYEESGEVKRDANNDIVWATDDRNQPIYRVAGRKRVGSYTEAIENGEIPSPETRAE